MNTGAYIGNYMTRPDRGRGVRPGRLGVGRERSAGGGLVWKTARRSDQARMGGGNVRREADGAGRVRRVPDVVSRQHGVRCGVLLRAACQTRMRRCHRLRHVGWSRRSMVVRVQVERCGRCCRSGLGSFRPRFVVGVPVVRQCGVRLVGCVRGEERRRSRRRGRCRCRTVGGGARTGLQLAGGGPLGCLGPGGAHWSRGYLRARMPFDSRYVRPVLSMRGGRRQRGRRQGGWRGRGCRLR